MKYALVLGAAAMFVATTAFAGEKAGDDMDWNAKVESHFKEVDANADGQVTEAELLAFVTAKAKADFAAMSGGDGAATLEEAKAFHKAMHEEMMKEHSAMDHGEHKTVDQ